MSPSIENAAIWVPCAWILALSVKPLCWLVSTICAPFSVLLKFYVRVHFAVPAVPAIFKHWRNTTMPVVANEQTDLPDLPAPLLAACDHAANMFSHCARNGIDPTHHLINAAIELPCSDFVFVEWCAQLGYREGLETRS